MFKVLFTLIFIGFTSQDCFAQWVDFSMKTTGDTIILQDFVSNFSQLKNEIANPAPRCVMEAESGTSSTSLYHKGLIPGYTAMSGSANHMLNADLIGPCSSIGVGTCPDTGKDGFIVEYNAAVVNPRLYVLCCKNGR